MLSVLDLDAVVGNVGGGRESPIADLAEDDLPSRSQIGADLDSAGLLPDVLLEHLVRGEYMQWSGIVMDRK